MTHRTVIAIVASVLVLVMIILGLTVIGSPMQARRLESDRNRAERLNHLHYELEAHFNSNGRQLPESLADLDPGGSGRPNPKRQFVGRDPETGRSFEYRRLTNSSYEVCAIFEEDTSNARDNEDRPYEETGFHDHKSGRQCFEQSVNDARGFPPAWTEREPVPIYD